MNIILIDPRIIDAPSHPLGLLYVAAVLEKQGHRVKVYDIPPFTRLDVPKMMKLDNPDAIGLTCTTPQVIRVLETARDIKRVVSHVPVIIGGVHPTVLPESLLSEEAVDHVVIGEGEITSVELFETLEREERPVNVKGIGYKKDYGKMVINTRRDLIQDLDEIPFPARHLLPDWHFTNLKIRGFWFNRGATIMSSRGCPFSCIFCSSHIMFGRKVRKRSPENVVQEIEHLVEKFKIDGLWFADDTFTLNKRWVFLFCDMLKRSGIDIRWGCQGRVDTVTKELLRAMKKVGCVQVDYGVESGSPKVLKAIKKGITPEQAKRAFKIAKEVGLRSMASFMVGNPEETLEDIDMTLRLAEEIDSDFTEFYYSTPYPGTELYEMAKKNEWIDLSLNYDKWIAGKQVDIPVMHINFNANELITIRSKLHNRFVYKNYASFLRDPRAVLFASRMILTNIAALKKGIKRFCKTKKVDNLLLSFIESHRIKDMKKYSKTPVIDLPA